MKCLIAYLENGKVRIKTVSYVPEGAQVMAVWLEKESV